jgi:hypothetical protein
MKRNANGQWIDRHGRVMRRHLVYASAKDRRYLCVVMAATPKAALKAAKSQGLTLRRDAVALLETPLSLFGA